MPCSAPIPGLTWDRGAMHLAEGCLYNGCLYKVILRQALSFLGRSPEIGPGPCGKPLRAAGSRRTG
jgi:hypothetical protein